MWQCASSSSWGWLWWQWLEPQTTWLHTVLAKYIAQFYPFSLGLSRKQGTVWGRQVFLSRYLRREHWLLNLEKQSGWRWPIICTSNPRRIQVGVVSPTSLWHSSLFIEATILCQCYHNTNQRPFEESSSQKHTARYVHGHTSSCRANGWCGAPKCHVSQEQFGE